MPSDLDNYKKVAILLVSLGMDISVEIFKHLDEWEIELISKEIARLGELDQEQIDEVIKDFHQRLLSAASSEGGLQYLREVLERAVGPAKAMGIIRHLHQIKPFSYLESVSGSQIAEIVSNEDPQIIALVLSYLPSGHAAEAFANLNDDLRKEVAGRMVMLEDVHREAIENVHKALEKVVSNRERSMSEKISFAGEGIKTLANILNAAPQQVEKNVMDHLKTVDDELAEEVRSNMFLFEDLVKFDDVSMQKILRQVDMRDLTLSLKIADEALKNKVFSNLSERVRETCQEELSYLGPVRLRNVEEAQQKVIATVRKLEAAGEIEIPHKGEEEKFV